MYNIYLNRLLHVQIQLSKIKMINTMNTMKNSPYFPDAIGLFILMILVAVLATFIPASEIPRIFWVPIYAVWAVGAIFVWRMIEAVNHRWILSILSSIGGALLWYVTTRAISHLTFGSEEPALSKVIDVLIALIISPGITFIAIAGWVRSLVQRK